MALQTTASRVERLEPVVDAVTLAPMNSLCLAILFERGWPTDRLIQRMRSTPDVLAAENPAANAVEVEHSFSREADEPYSDTLFFDTEWVLQVLSRHGGKD